MHYDMKKCGARIQQLRKAKGMTQEELFHVSLDYIIVGKKPQDNLKKRLFAVIQELSAVTDEL